MKKVSVTVSIRVGMDIEITDNQYAILQQDKFDNKWRNTISQIETKFFDTYIPIIEPLFDFVSPCDITEICDFGRDGPILYER